MSGELGVDVQAAQKKVKKPHRKLNTLTAVSIVVICISGTMVGGFLYQHRKDSRASSTIPTALLDRASVGDFPLYFSESTSYFRFNDTSVTVDSTTVTFSYMYAGNKNLVVSEQKRPTVMEQINKVKDFDTRIGHAYIANVNGSTTGIVLTNKTLIVLNATQSIDNDQLQEFMLNFEQV